MILMFFVVACSVEGQTNHHSGFQKHRANAALLAWVYLTALEKAVHKASQIVHDDSLVQLYLERWEHLSKEIATLEVLPPSSPRCAVFPFCNQKLQCATSWLPVSGNSPKLSDLTPNFQGPIEIPDADKELSINLSFPYQFYRRYQHMPRQNAVDLLQEHEREKWIFGYDSYTAAMYGDQGYGLCHQADAKLGFMAVSPTTNLLRFQIKANTNLIAFCGQGFSFEEEHEERTEVFVDGCKIAAAEIMPWPKLVSMVGTFGCCAVNVSAETQHELGINVLSIPEMRINTKNPNFFQVSHVLWAGAEGTS
jgi:hypothetical protein